MTHDELDALCVLLRERMNANGTDNVRALVVVVEVQDGDGGQTTYAIDFDGTVGAAVCISRALHEAADSLLYNVLGINF